MAKLSSFWCRLLLFLALLCVSPKVLARDITFSDYTKLVKSPTLDKPWTEIKFMFFDEDGKGNDSFFQGCAWLVIDGVPTSVFFREIACEETNGGDGAKSKDNPGNWYDVHTYTLRGTTYTVRLYNAYRESNGEHYVTVYISPDKIRPGEKHTFGIAGNWRADRKPFQPRAKTFDVTMPTGISNYLVNQSYSRPIKHTSFDKCIFPVNVNSKYGPTTFATNGEAVDSYDDLNDMKFTDPATMASSATVEKGQTEGWVELGVKEIALVEKFIPVQWSYYAGAKKSEIGGTYVYDWTMGCLPGYPRSLDLSTEQNQWKKEITVKWGSSGGAYFYVKSYGKWAVTRVEKKNSAVVRTPVATVDFTGNGNLSVVDDNSLQYDTDYKYEVSFIPTGMTEDTTATKILTSTVEARLVRDVPITITKIDEGENDLTVYWNAPQLGGNNKFQYKVYRAEGNSQNDGTTSSPSYSWEEVGKIDVSNYKQTEYSFKDTKNLKSCTQYFYKVELVVEAWNDKTFDSGEKQLKSYRIKGKSSVTSLEASKGDYTGVVKLSWKAEQKGTTSTKYVLSRRIIGGTQWSQVYAVDGTSQSYYYEDNTALAGNYYQYRVRSYVQCDNDQFTSGEELCDGFCRSTGTLSGRISYDQGTAVAGVKVVLTKSDGQKDTEQFYTLQTSGAGSGVRQTFSDEEKGKFARAYTAQLLVSPASQIDMTDGNAVIFSLGDRHRLSLGTKTGNRYPLFLETGSTSANTGLWLKESCFTSVTLSCDSLSGFRVTLIDDNDSIRTYTNAAGNLAASVDVVSFGGTASENDQKSCFAGYIDEMRLFSGKALTEEEIKENYNHPLSGVEDGLFIYWPVDEGIEDQLTAYDYSKTNGVANAHHGNIKLCKVSGTLPPANMLSLFAVTDSQGNYTLRGVPFNGSGTTYTITPQLGTHSFSPIYSSRYVSASSLVYSGVDFSDQSSFPVSGKVYYANTTIPVEGCTVYVDGKAASNNGKLAQTSSDGTFSVSVPIGRHYIELSKEGHVFVGNGRYPEDPEGIGTTFLCEQPISNLQFNDSTLVNFTGRIAGGLHEMKKNVGFGLSNNNIGQTLITLECLDTNNGQAIFNAVTVKDNGIIVTTEGENATSWTRSITTERTISTSSDPAYVGAQDDVFVGSSTNLVFGDANEVTLLRDGTGQDKAKLDCHAITITGLDYDTEFMYSANYIENTLLPNLEKVRNSLLITLPAESVDSYVNTTDKPVYVTALEPTDERFGSDNDDADVWSEEEGLCPQPSSVGPSYRMVMPQGVDPTKKFVDEVSDMNNAIKNWYLHLKTNEQQKVLANEQASKYRTNNFSFDSGSSLTMSQTVDSTYTKSSEQTTMGLVHVLLSTGMIVNGFGFEAILENNSGGGTHKYDEESTTQSSNFTYTLAEDGDGDALSVDVYQYDNWGPIFRTMAGQTSAPYEGEVRTSYYKPGEKVIMEATQQIEVPEIMVDNMKWSKVSNVPTGGAANFTLQLRNNSETQDDVYFRLISNDENNANGAKISIDGKVLTEGRLIKVPATETVVKQLQLEQTNQGQLQFDSIAIVLASQYQYDSSGTWDVIADTVYISADFMPSSSAVNMALDKNVVNTITSDTLGITFNQFDRTYPGLKAFRIQTYAPGASDWLTLKEYVVDPKNLTVNNELLPNVPHVVYNYNMHGLADGNYRFRVLSVSSYGGDEVARSSNEILIAKDMVKPKPLGLPQPSNGILDIADDISVTFNEEIVKGALSNDGNFEITGVLNGSEIAHNTAFAMQGKELAAATEASFSLAEKDFSTDMWLKATGEGTVLSHGNGTEKFKIALDRGMHLVLSVGNDTFTSSETVPQDSWCYLTVSYKRDGNGGLLNATVADEATAQTKDLFRDCVTEAYNGAGTLSVGENLKGAIHELTLWDVAHDNTEAQRQRQLTKMPSTAHLIGYWKMDEGDGTLINDYARNRHLVATGDTWYLNNVNKAVSLDGNTHLAFFAGDLAVGTEDNRAVELWVKAGKQQAEAQILQMGDIDVWTDKNGQIRLTASDNVQQTSTINVADNQWHHIALNVLRSGNTSLYVDGQRALSLSSRNVGSLNSDSIFVGVRRRINPDLTFGYDRRLKGGIDEVRVWNATLDASTLADNRKLRLTGKETGLVAYFPFETKILDSGNQLQTVPVDTCIVAMNMTRRMVGSSSGLMFSDVAPALKEKPVETNVPFSFTASNEKIVINIDEAPARIEGCTLNFRVKRVKDVNGNYCEPVCWSAYVHRNALSWMEDNVAMEQEVGQQSTFSAVIVNKGGTQQEWTISNLPQWLKAEATSGMLSPLSQQTVCFTVAKSCPVGRYSETVYLVNSDDIAVPLTLELNVRGSVPTWTVDNGKYSSSMNLVGSLSIQGIPSNDPDDIVAAFVDGECRGVAHPVYNKRYDDYFVMLDIAGNADDKNKNVTFRVYDASTGTVWPMVKTSRDIDFNVSGVFGSFQEPVVLDALEMIEQTMTLGEGWNWMSLSVVANDMNATSLMSPISGSVDVVKSKKRSIMRYENLWDGGDILMNNREMYKVLMNNAEELSVIGLSPTDSERTITVRNGWNWLAYNGTAAISLGDAFASLNPVDGDLVKGKSGFAIFDGYEWAGTLQALVPSQGYMYLSKADADRSFSYPKSMAKAKAAAMEYLPVTMTVFNPVDDSKYPGNMTVVARVVYCGKPLAECETGVFAGSECRTSGTTDSDGIVFLTIPGESVEKLTFRIKYGADILISDNTLEYSDDAVVGNRKSPFEIAFDERSITTSIVEVENSEADEKWYTYDGCTLKQKPKAAGVYIRVRNGKAEKIAVR